MHFFTLSQVVQFFPIFNEMKNNEEVSFLSYQLNAGFAQFTNSLVHKLLSISLF